MLNEQNQTLQAPQPIQPDDELEDFDCGNSELNDWLKKRSLKNENTGASRTYVVIVGQKVIALFAHS